MREAVTINEAEMSFLWALDAGVLAPDGDTALRLVRSRAGWLDELRTSLVQLPPTTMLAPNNAYVARSHFERTNERVGSSTLASQESRKLMPLRVPALETNGAEWHETDCWRWRLHSVSIGALGSIGLRFEAELAQATSPEELIGGYNHLIQELTGRLGPLVADAAEILCAAGGPLEGLEFEVPADVTELTSLLTSFECLDLRFDVRDEAGELVKLPIKSIISSGNYVSVVRELAAISRMTKTEPDHYDLARLEKFQHADIGNREDELWIVNSNRVVRSHPDREKQRVRWFYEDSITLAESFVQQLAGLEYVERWLEHTRSELRSVISQPHGSRDPDDVGAVLATLERVTDLTAHPVSLVTGIRHPFFHSLAERMLSEMRLEVTAERVAKSTSLFMGVTSAIFSHDVSVSSRQISQESADATTTMKRLTWFIAVATLLVLIATLLTVFESDDQTSGNKPPATTTTDPGLQDG